MTMSPWKVTTDPLTLRRMGKLGEEAGELLAVTNRVVIQGIDEVDPSSGKTNRQRLTDEVADVIAQCETTIRDLGLDQNYIAERVLKKCMQMFEWEAVLKGQE